VAPVGAGWHTDQLGEASAEGAQRHHRFATDGTWDKLLRGHWRGLATRYDKRAIVHRGGLVLAALLLWLTDLGDTS